MVIVLLVTPQIRTEFRQLGQIEILGAWRCDSWFTVYFQCILVGGPPRLYSIFTHVTLSHCSMPPQFFLGISMQRRVPQNSAIQQTSMPYRFQRPATEQWQQCSAIPDIIAWKLCPICRQKWQIFFNIGAFQNWWPKLQEGWLRTACMLRAADTLRTSHVASNSLVPCLDTVGRMLGVIAQPQKGHPWLAYGRH